MRCSGVNSLQLTAEQPVATPVNWTQGDDVIIVPSVSDEQAGRSSRAAGRPRNPLPADRAAAARLSSVSDPDRAPVCSRPSGIAWTHQWAAERTASGATAPRPTAREMKTMPQDNSSLYKTQRRIDGSRELQPVADLCDGLGVALRVSRRASFTSTGFTCIRRSTDRSIRLRRHWRRVSRSCRRLRPRSRTTTSTRD